MIKSTVELIEFLKNDSKKKHTVLVDSYVTSILKIGSKEDATLLLDIYLNNPFDYYSACLLPLFKRFGDIQFADKIFKVVISDGKLLANINPFVLSILGQLQYKPVEPILFNYAFGETDYSFHRDAVVGLLNFDCKTFLENIKLSINDCLKKHLFPEFTPALVCKLTEREKLLKELYQLGDTIASTDCNAGIILGFSLCGNEGKLFFKKALFNPNWECYSFGTGTIYYAYEGMKNLNISFSELYIEIKQLNEKDQIEYSLTVFFNLLKMRVVDNEDENMESFKFLYGLLFDWISPNYSNNLIDLATQVGLQDSAYEFERILEIKMTEEIITKNFIVNTAISKQAVP